MDGEKSILEKEIMDWHISVPIFRNTVILKQLGIAIGIPFGILALVIGFSSGKSVYTLYALGLIGALLLFSWLLIMLIYRGKYDAEFVLDAKGVICRTQTGQAKKNRALNTLTVIMGLLAGKPAVTGAGLMAQSRQEVYMRWKNVTKVKYKPKSYVILLRAGWIDNIALFCTRENYTAVEQFVAIKTEHLKSS